MLLTVGILAKDSAHCLTNAVESALKLGDEVLIRVDRSSIDGTLELAKSISDNKIRIFEYDFVGFGSARNGLIHEALGEWIFMLDADEVMDDKDISRIRFMLKNKLSEAVYSFPRKNWADLQRTRYMTDYYPDRQYRLFRAGGQINYGEQRVHEMPQGGTRMPFPIKDIHINHFCFAYRNSEDWQRVNLFYKSLREGAYHNGSVDN